MEALRSALWTKRTKALSQSTDETLVGQIEALVACLIVQLTSKVVRHDCPAQGGCTGRQK